MAVRCKEEWISNSVERLSCEVKIRPVLENEFLSVCVDSLIIWQKPNCDAILSSEVPSDVLLCLLITNSVLQWNHLELQVRTDFFEGKYSGSSKLLENIAKAFWDCCEVYKFQSLLPGFKSKVML